MSTQEIFNELLPALALNQQAIVSNTTTVGNIIDTYNADKGIKIDLFSGVITDGVFVPLFEESDDVAFATSNDVADINIVPVKIGTIWYKTGQEAISQFILTDDNIIRSFGLIGTKRYIRLSMISTGVTSGGFFTAISNAKGNLSSVWGL